MNKLLLKSLVLASISIASLAAAQFRNKNPMDRLEGFDQQKFSWGFYLNGSMFDYKLVLHPRYGTEDDKNLVTANKSAGFGAGLIGRMRISENFDLRMEPGLQFIQREIYFNTQSNSQYNAYTLEHPAFTPITLTEDDKLREIKNTLIDIPILLEVHGDRWYNTRAYFAGGVNYIVNLQSNADSNDDNLQQIWRSTTHNFAWSAEMGVQIYFRRFKLTPAIRGTFFMNNEVVADNPTTPPYWTAALSTAKTRALMFVLKFE